MSLSIIQNAVAALHRELHQSVVKSHQRYPARLAALGLYKHSDGTQVFIGTSVNRGSPRYLAYLLSCRSS